MRLEVWQLRQDWVVRFRRLPSCNLVNIGQEGGDRSLRRWSSSEVFFAASPFRFLRAAGSGEGDDMMEVMSDWQGRDVWDEEAGGLQWLWGRGLTESALAFI